LQHVKLARDRRKRKSRIKAAIFFAALLLILTGIFLAFKDTADYDPSLQSNLEPEMVDNVQYQSLTSEKTESDKSQAQAGEHPETKLNANKEDATSYDDDLLSMSDHEISIRLLVLDDAENISEARAAANAIVAYEYNKGVERAEVVDYDTDGFKRLVERVSGTISKFREDPDYGYRDREYICDQVDSLVFAITG